MWQRTYPAEYPEPNPYAALSLLARRPNLTAKLEEFFQVSHLRYRQHPAVRRCLSFSSTFASYIPNLHYYLSPSYLKSDSLRVVGYASHEAQSQVWPYVAFLPWGKRQR